MSLFFCDRYIRCLYKMAVTRLECTDLDLDARSDPEPFPEHAIIDFTGFTDSHIKTVSKRLRECAVERDWVFHS